MSVAGDLGITQVVDTRQGAHIRMPRGIFPVD
jgi:acetamidase/formamidase